MIKALNRVLSQELSAINQYFLHARILEGWGLERLGALEYKASLDEMKHADALIKRILFLEGHPNIDGVRASHIGKDIPEVVALDLQEERKAIVVLREVIALAEEVRDYTSRDLFVDILKSEEEHIGWLEVQEQLIGDMGLQNYIQSQVGPLT